jgi:hypothetical protein
MPLLHPSIPAGTFDLPRLLAYEPPVRWRPEPGEVVDGTLVKITKVTSFRVAADHLFILVPPKAYDEFGHLYSVVRASGIVLKNAVERLRPEPGERIAVKFHGWFPTVDGKREYQKHEMLVRRNGVWLRSS